MKSKRKSNNNEEEQNGNDPKQFQYVAIPPDGGYGWVIVIAAMLCNLICDGTLFAFGVMKIHLQKHFGCSDMLILMVGSVPCGVYLFVGPIVSGLANLYGCRIIIIIGSVGAAIAMVLSTFSPNVWVMMIIYGIFGGLFFGMIYLPSCVMVSFYFDKKRAVANGIVTAGTGLGVLSFGPLADVLMTKYGWEVGIYVFAVLLLLCILFGALMIPLEPQKIPTETTDENPTENKIDASSPLSSSNLPPGTSTHASMPLLEKKSEPTEVHVNLSRTNSRQRRLSAVSHKSSSTIDSHNLMVMANPEDAVRPLYKKDALFMGSKQQLDRASRISLPTHASYVSGKDDTKSPNESPSGPFSDILHAMTDFSILKNKKILLICIGNIFSMLGYYLPIMCLVSFAIEDIHVESSKASFLMTIFGLSNTISRFAGGPLAMIPGLNPLRFHNAMLYGAGIATILVAYAFNFTTCALYAGLCGFMIAPHISLMPSIVLDCVGLDRFTNAYGILFLFRGISSIAGPPLAGFLKDYTKNYDVAFAIGGSMIIIAAFFHFLLGFFNDRKDREVQA